MGMYKHKILIAISIMTIVVGSVLAGCGNISSVSTKPGEIEATQEEVAENAGINQQSQVENTEQLDKSEDIDVPEEITISIEEESEEPSENSETEEDGEIPKDVDLIFFMGQSNMSGCGGDASAAPAVVPGAGYEFRAVTDPFTLHEITEPFGYAESIVGGIWDVPGGKKGSLVSSFVNKYHEATGRCVIAVSASAGGTSTEYWLTPGFVTDISVRVKNAQDYLNNNGFNIKNQYVVWLQGESDALEKTSVEGYKTNMDDIMRPMFISGFTKVFIITPGQINNNSHFFDNIINCQINMCRESGYYALASTALCGVSPSYMVDEWHYNQKVLNLVGEDAAEAVAYYANEGKEKCIYDYKHDSTFIPDYFDYGNDEAIDRKDINGILAQ